MFDYKYIIYFLALIKRKYAFGFIENTSPWIPNPAFWNPLGIDLKNNMDMNFPSFPNFSRNSELPNGMKVTKSYNTSSSNYTFNTKDSYGNNFYIKKKTKDNKGSTKIKYTRNAGPNNDIITTILEKIDGSPYTKTVIGGNGSDEKLSLSNDDTIMIDSVVSELEGSGINTDFNFDFTNPWDFDSIRNEQNKSTTRRNKKRSRENEIIQKLNKFFS